LNLRRLERDLEDVIDADWAEEAQQLNARRLAEHERSVLEASGNARRAEAAEAVERLARSEREANEASRLAQVVAQAEETARLAQMAVETAQVEAAC